MKNSVQSPTVHFYPSYRTLPLLALLIPEGVGFFRTTPGGSPQYQPGVLQGNSILTPSTGT